MQSKQDASIAASTGQQEYVQLEKGIKQAPVQYAFHWLALIFMILAWSSLIVIIYGLVTQTYNTSTVTVFMVFYPISCVLYWLEVWLTSTWKYLKHINGKEDVPTFVTRIRKTPPRLWMSVECYHEETRWRTVYETDSNGRSHWHEESYTEHVTTHRDTRNIAYNSWKDTSPEFASNVLKMHAVRIEFAKSFTFANEASKLAYGRQVQAFHMHHQYCDRQRTFDEGMEIDGFEDYVLSVTDVNKRPWWLSLKAYIIFSLLGISWPYRLWFERHSARGNFMVVKEVNV